MKMLYKNIKDGLLYILYNMGGFYMAIPHKHSGRPINHCNVSEFIPIVDK